MNPELPPNDRTELEARVTALLLGETTPEEAAVLRQQMAQDPALAALHQRLRLTLDLVRETAATTAGALSERPAPLKLSPSRRDALLASFKTIRPKGLARPRRRRNYRLIQLAAAAAIVLMLAVLLLPKLAKSKNMTMGALAKTHADGVRLAIGSEKQAVNGRIRLSLPDAKKDSGPAGPTGGSSYASLAPAGPKIGEAEFYIRGADATSPTEGSKFTYRSSEPQVSALTHTLPSDITLIDSGAMPVTAAKPSTPARAAIYTGDSSHEAASGKALVSEIYDYNGTAPTASEGVKLNLRNVTVDQALNYLADKSGFTIDRRTSTSAANVPGTVDLQSATPLSKDETVAVLNKVLASRNLTAIQDGKNLSIMTIEDARANASTPVQIDTSWTSIPADKQLVTEVIPVHSLDPRQVVTDLASLTPPMTVMNTSDAGNAIVMTGSKAEVQKMSETVKAMDSTGNGNLEVFKTTYADSKELAAELNAIFANSQSIGHPAGTAAIFGGGRGRGGASGETSSRPGASVNAVSDDQNNAVVISAPKDFLPGISNIISKLDIPQGEKTEVKLFTLQNADSSDVTSELHALFPDQNASGKSGLQKNQVAVNAVADPRTQSVLVTASRDEMNQIEQIVDKMDSKPSGHAQLNVYVPQNSDVLDFSGPLSDLLTSADGRRSSSTSTAGNALQQRITSGASSTVTTASSSISGGGAGGGSSGSGGRQMEERNFHVDPSTVAQGFSGATISGISGQANATNGGGYGGYGGGMGGYGGGGYGGAVQGSATFPTVDTTAIPYLTSKTPTSQPNQPMINYFQGIGVDLTPTNNDGSFVIYNDKTGDMLVRAPADQLDKMDGVLESIKKTPQKVQIDTKFASVDQTDTKGLNFGMNLGNVAMRDRSLGVQAGTAPSYQGAPSVNNPSGIFPGAGPVGSKPGQIAPSASDGDLTAGLRTIAPGNPSGQLVGLAWDAANKADEARKKDISAGGGGAGGSGSLGGQASLYGVIGQLPPVTYTLDPNSQSIIYVNPSENQAGKELNRAPNLAIARTGGNMGRIQVDGIPTGTNGGWLTTSTNGGVQSLNALGYVDTSATWTPATGNANPGLGDLPLIGNLFANSAAHSSTGTNGTFTTPFVNNDFYNSQMGKSPASLDGSEAAKREVAANQRGGQLETTDRNSLLSSSAERLAALKPASSTPASGQEASARARNIAATSDAPKSGREFFDDNLTVSSMDSFNLDLVDEASKVSKKSADDRKAGDHAGVQGTNGSFGHPTTFNNSGSLIAGVVSENGGFATVQMTNGSYAAADAGKGALRFYSLTGTVDTNAFYKAQMGGQYDVVWGMTNAPANSHDKEVKPNSFASTVLTPSFGAVAFWPLNESTDPSSGKAIAYDVYGGQNGNSIANGDPNAIVAYDVIGGYNGIYGTDAQDGGGITAGPFAPLLGDVPILGDLYHNNSAATSHSYVTTAASPTVPTAGKTTLNSGLTMMRAASPTVPTAGKTTNSSIVAWITPTTTINGTLTTDVTDGLFPYTGALIGGSSYTGSTPVSAWYNGGGQFTSAGNVGTAQQANKDSGGYTSSTSMFSNSLTQKQLESLFAAGAAPAPDAAHSLLGSNNWNTVAMVTSPSSSSVYLPGTKSAAGTNSLHEYGDRFATEHAQDSSYRFNAGKAEALTSDARRTTNEQSLSANGYLSAAPATNAWSATFGEVEGIPYERWNSNSTSSARTADSSIRKPASSAKPADAPRGQSEIFEITSLTEPASIMPGKTKSDQKTASRAENETARITKSAKTESSSPSALSALSGVKSELEQEHAEDAEKGSARSAVKSEPANPQSAIRNRESSTAPIIQSEVQSSSNAFSTFSLNVSDVCFKLAATSLQKGLLPDPAAIRTEEFINALDYRGPEPAPGAAVGFNWERAGYPFAHNRDLLRFAVKTATEGRQAGRPLNLVLLLDKSGSMERADRVSIIHEALRVLATQLGPQDTLSVVIFSRTARLVADGVPGNQAAKLAAELDAINPEGGTNLEEAMRLAYEAALRHYLANGENRVVLLTDGAANLGDVDPDQLKKKVEANRAQGIALDCFGVGWEEYNDSLLEVLSRTGGGRYGFVNTPQEAATEFAGQLAGALRVAASDVKVQVEFNTNRVISWRQLGYAKDQLTKEQFRDNSVKAAQLAVAESGNALYTVELKPAGDGPICTVYVRYRTPGTSDYSEHAWDVPYEGASPALDKASPAMRLAATASAFSEWLAGTPYAAEVTLNSLQSYLRGIPEFYGIDARPKQLETMLREARSITGQ